MSDLKKFNEDRKVRISHEFLDKYRTGKLGIHAQKLLFGLAQCLDQAEDLFPDWDIDIRGLFDYLNLSEDNNDRYEIVRNAIRELAKNPLEYKISDKHWGLINWLSYAKFDESNSMFVRLRFTDDCKPFLLNYKQYCEMQTKYYVGLTSANAMWLYPHLRNAYKKKGGIHTITIQRLQEITYTDSLAAYDINKNSSANKDFLKRVLGVEKIKVPVGITDKFTYEWVPIKNKEGKPIGTIAEINDKTDITVEKIRVLKIKSRVYNTVEFTIKLKPEVRRKNNNQKAALVQIEELKKRRIPGKKYAHVSYETIVEMANARRISVQQLAMELGYKQSQDGKSFYKLIRD